MRNTDSESIHTKGCTIRVYTTTTDVKLILESGEVESGAWLTEKAAHELIALLQKVLRDPGDLR